MRERVNQMRKMMRDDEGERKIEIKGEGRLRDDPKTPRLKEGSHVW